MNIFLIAEIGINHNGDMSIAKKLIDYSKEAGFDAVKFQKRTVEKVYSKDYLDSPRESPWGKTQREQKKGLEFEFQEYQEIDEYCKKKNILWSASAWDIDSQKFLNQFNLKFNKVASPMMGNFPLLKEIASEKKKTFISTGMCDLEDIDKVVDVFKQKNCEFELMHCVSTYPMKDEDANLLAIKTLRDRYNCNVGYSGHETSLAKIGIVAATLGATSIERHITLDRAMYGSDQSASISYEVLKNFTESVRVVQKILGDGEKKVTEKEIPIRKKLRIDIK
jgi:N-acetylneuraminate synthase